jgi:hypothetical protein
LAHLIRAGRMAVLRQQRPSRRLRVLIRTCHPGRCHGSRLII